MKNKGRSFDQMVFNKKPKKTWGSKDDETVVESPRDDYEDAVVCEVETDLLQPEVDQLKHKVDDQHKNLDHDRLPIEKQRAELTIQNDDDNSNDEIVIKADHKDITTLEKIIAKLQAEKEELALENDRLKYHNSEMKEIIVDMGLTGKMELLENYKNENEKKDFIIKKLENKLNDNQAYIENLKTNLFSGINQLFEQKPMQTLQIEEIKNENISKIPSESEESIENKVLNLKSEGKSPRQIASITNLATIKIDEILKKHERVEKHA